MSLLGYAVFLGERAPACFPWGITGAAVYAIGSGELAAAVSRVDDCPAWSLHARAFVQTVADLQDSCGAVIPMRLGCRFTVPEDVRAALDARAGEFRKLLQEFEGCSEWTVRLAALPARLPVASASSGSAWLAGRQAYYQSLEAAQAALQARARELLGGTAGWYRRARQESLRDGLAVHFLVPRNSTAQWRARVDELMPGSRASGPWPPYNFVEP